jgi:hypothetical protein
MITTNDAINSNIGQLIKNDKMLSLMPNVSLSLFLFYLKVNEDSINSTKWNEYIKTLPTKFHTPLYFNLDEIMMLKPAQCFRKLFKTVSIVLKSN